MLRALRTGVLSMENWGKYGREYYDGCDGRAEAGKDCGLHMVGDLPGIGEALEVS